MIPTQEQLETFANLSPQGKKEVCKDPRNFLIFFSYFFIDFIKYPFAQFHAEWADDLADLYEGKITSLVLCTARETAKSSMAMAWYVWLIVNHENEYYNVDSYDKTNAETMLYEIVLHLQTNKRLIEVYGQLFNRERSMEEKQRKSVSDFITNNNVRVEAHSTQQPVRGRRHGSERPSYVLADDFETLTTVRSEELTRNIAQHFSEFAGGLDQKKGRVIYLCNYLSETGNVAMLEEKAKQSDDANDASRQNKMRFRKVPRVNENNQPTWPERDVMTDEELKEPHNQNKVSIETKMKEMRNPETGDADWLREMQLQPVDPLGDGPDKQGFMALFTEDVRNSKVNQTTFADAPPYVIGVDPAGEGADKSSIAVRSAFHAKIYATENKSNQKSLALLVIAAAKEHKVPASGIVVDAFGIGFKVVQELAILGWPVKAVNVGEKTVMEMRGITGYNNDRAYMYFQMKEWLMQGGQLCYNDDIKQQLRLIRHRTNESGMRQLMPKKEIIKRGHRSPDELDSIALTFLTDLRHLGAKVNTADSEPISRFL